MLPHVAFALVALVTLACTAAPDPGDGPDGGRDGKSDAPNQPPLSTELQSIAAPTPDTFDHFGTSVAVSGEWMAVGRPGHVRGNFVHASGAVDVYRRDASGWTFFETVLAGDYDEDESHEFGRSVAIAGGYLVVGAPGWDEGNRHQVGAAYVYNWDGTSWTPDGILRREVLEDFNLFGDAVAVSGERILVGVSADEVEEGLDNTGAVYAYVKESGAWVLEARLEALFPTSWQKFGTTVSVDGDLAAIGSEGDVVHVFRHGDAGWKLQAQFGGPSPDIRFGEYVDLEGDLLAVSATEAPGVGEEPGAVFVYRWSGDEWLEEARLEAPGLGMGNGSGQRLATSGGRIAIGRRFDDQGAESAGSVSVHSQGDDGWNLEHVLLAPTPVEGARFGNSVDLSGGQVVIGAPMEAQGDEEEAGAVFANY